MILGCSGDGNDADPDAPAGSTPFPTQIGGTRLPPGSTPSPPSAGLVEARLTLSGVFLEPRLPGAEPDDESPEEPDEPDDEPTPVPPAPSEVTSRELPPRPDSPFRAWDGATVVLYDVDTGEQHDFGSGRVWSPPFGGGYFVYTSDNEVWLVDLETLERESIGQGIGAYFMGEQHVVINPGDNMFYALRLNPRTRTPLADLTSPLLRNMVEQRWAGKFRGAWLDQRYAIYNPQNGYQVCNQEEKTYRRCLSEYGEVWVVEDLNTGEVLLSFEANKALPAGREELVIATTPQCRDGEALVDCYDILDGLEAQNPSTSPPAYVQGTSNIFLVDITTGEAEFVATVTYNAGAGAWPMQWALAADERHVIWSDSYCGDPRGRATLFDRETREMTQLDQAAWVSLHEGRLGIGEFGAKVLLDPATLEYIAVLPQLSEVAWSADYRFAAAGQTFSHPDICD